MNKTVLILVIFLSWSNTFAQDHENLKLYYPDQIEWPLEINVDVHVMQCTPKDPRNFTPADTAQIHEIFKLVNQMYNHLEPPTLKVPGVPFYDASRIWFRVHKIHFHVDSLGWLAEWIEPAGQLKIEKYEPAQKTFQVKGKTFRNYKRPDGVLLEYKSGRTQKLTYDTSWLENNISYIRVKEAIDSAGINRLGYYAKRDDNCARSNYEKYGAGDIYHMHVFLTQSIVSNIVFGCGPSKDYLNLTNAWKSDNWVTAQLLAHELGHCLGLSHTNSPQFPDLPRKDQFGWLACDTISVSNNIMGYNICRNYLSPMQMGSVHRMFQTREDHIRLTTAHTYDSKKIYRVKRNRELDKNMVINGNLLVQKNAVFKIKRELFIHAQTRIILEEGAVIEVDGGRLTVLDKGTNTNIIYCKKYGSKKMPKKKGEIKTTNHGKITGLQTP